LGPSRKLHTTTFVLICVLILRLIPVAGQGNPSPPTDFDLVIFGGRILDGTGNPWFKADVGISAGKIVEIGKIEPSRGCRGSTRKA
jgi:adenine deaminase